VMLELSIGDGGLVDWLLRFRSRVATYGARAYRDRGRNTAAALAATGGPGILHARHAPPRTVPVFRSYMTEVMNGHPLFCS